MLPRRRGVSRLGRRLRAVLAVCGPVDEHVLFWMKGGMGEGVRCAVVIGADGRGELVR